MPRMTQRVPRGDGGVALVRRGRRGVHSAAALGGAGDGVDGVATVDDVLRRSKMDVDLDIVEVEKGWLRSPASNSILTASPSLSSSRERRTLLPPEAKAPATTAAMSNNSDDDDARE